jgi:hypothetical protein
VVRGAAERWFDGEAEGVCAAEEKGGGAGGLVGGEG